MDLKVMENHQWQSTSTLQVAFATSAAGKFTNDDNSRPVRTAELKNDIFGAINKMVVV